MKQVEDVVFVIDDGHRRILPEDFYHASIHLSRRHSQGSEDVVERGVVVFTEKAEVDAAGDVPQRLVLLDHVAIGLVTGQCGLGAGQVVVAEGHDAVDGLRGRALEVRRASP